MDNNERYKEFLTPRVSAYLVLVFFVRVFSFLPGDAFTASGEDSIKIPDEEEANMGPPL